MSVGFDTNLLIYSFDRTDPDKHLIARTLLGRLLDRDVVVPMQVISETLAAAHRKRHLSVPDARLACEALADALTIEAATTQDALAASRLAQEHRLQFFDAQIVALYHRLGASVLLTEDMQDGATIGGVRIINPFNPGNAELLDILLTPLPGTA